MKQTNNKAAECRKYSRNQALMMLDEFEHYGPWGEVVVDALFTDSEL